MCDVVLCPVPDCIHAFVLSDELNELLDSQAELKTTLPKKQTKDASKFKPLKCGYPHSLYFAGRELISLKQLLQCW